MVGPRGDTGYEGLSYSDSYDIESFERDYYNEHIEPEIGLSTLESLTINNCKESKFPYFEACRI